MSHLYMTPFIKELVNMDSRIYVYPDKMKYIFNGSMVDAFKFGMYKPTKEKIYIPGVFPRTSHQIAHMVEMTNYSRCLQIEWGMGKHSFNKDINYIDNDVEVHVSANASKFFAALSREVRVRAIEGHMCVDAWNKGSRALKNIFDNKSWVPNNSFLPFGRFKEQKDVQTWVDDLCEKTYNAWGLDRIEDEWCKKLNYIRDWMETSESMH